MPTQKAEGYRCRRDNNCMAAVPRQPLGWRMAAGSKREDGFLAWPDGTCLANDEVELW